MLTSALSVSTTAGCSFLTIENSGSAGAAWAMPPTHIATAAAYVRTFEFIRFFPQWNCDYSAATLFTPPLPMPTPGPEHVYKEKLAQGSFEIQKCAGLRQACVLSARALPALRRRQTGLGCGERSRHHLLDYRGTQEA